MAAPPRGHARRPAPSRPSARTVAVYHAAARLGDLLWQFQLDNELTSTEMLMILLESETRLIKHLVLGDPHPSEI